MNLLDVSLSFILLENEQKKTEQEKDKLNFPINTQLLLPLSLLFIIVRPNERKKKKWKSLLIYFAVHADFFMLLAAILEIFPPL